ncbi:hypothetical protein AGMMS49587_01890 [Spirochaetia bacterium]|nr:hypothetical protein AGMMS49587_01890 [Spirochaetia bacterium]
MVYLKRGILLILFFAGVLLSFPSCTANISGRLDTGGSGEFSVSTSLGNRMAALLRSLSGATGSGGGEFTLSGPVIAKSMADAPGVASVSFRNTGPFALEGAIKIAKIGDFLAPAGGRQGFITLEEGQTGGRLGISLNRDAGPEILSRVSPEITDYLSALMSPIATGEILTKAEYLDLVSSVYGQAVAEEISRGSIRAAIDFPGPIISVKGGTYTGRRAEFTVPLLDLLVLERPLSYEVSWK